MDSSQVVALSHTRVREKVISRKGCGCTGVLCVGPIPTHPTNGRASEHGNASEMLSAYLGEMPHMTRWAEALPTRATKKYKYVGCPFVANHGTQEALYARGMHGGHNWRTYMAGDASVQSTIRPKHPKGTTSESAVEREKRITIFVRYTCSER